jgi:acyl-CoA thioester hydrolase
MTSDGKPEARVELALRQRDVDAVGHVNQAVYHELLEDARADFFAQVLPELPFTGYVLARVELDYRREVRIDAGHLVAETRVADVGRSKIELEHRLLLPDETVAAEARAILVAWDGEQRSSRPLTDSERARLLGE